MAGLLFAGAIPAAMVGLVKTAGGLIALRYCPHVLIRNSVFSNAMVSHSSLGSSTDSLSVCWVPHLYPANFGPPKCSHPRY